MASEPLSNKKKEAEASSFLLVPLTGLEPVQCRHRGILSRYPFPEFSALKWTIPDFFSTI